MTIAQYVSQAALQFLVHVASGASAQAPATPVQLSPSQMVDRVAECGIPITDVTIRDDRDMHEDVIAIAAGPALSDPQLACVARVSLAAFIYVIFTDAGQQQRYDTIYHPIENKNNVTQGRAWLESRGLLNKLPRYDPPRQALASYGRELETLCGIPRGGVLTAARSTLTIRPDLIGAPANKPFRGVMTDGQLECLINAAAASNLGEHGAGFGFIGNAAATTQP